MKINIEKTYYRIILLFPIATLLQNNLEVINKLLFGILFLLQLVVFFRKNTILNYSLSIILFAFFSYDILITNGLAYNINEYFYFPFAIIFLLYSLKNKKNMKKYFMEDKKYIINIVKIWTALVFISIFVKSSWTTSWGGAVYFGSFCQSIWRLAPSALFISIITIGCMNLYGNKKFFYFMILPLFCFLMGGTRTYLIIGTIIFFLGWYYFTSSKKQFYMSLIPVTIILIIGILNSSIMDKLDSVNYTKDSYFDFWGTITSGRSVFWEADLEAFKNFDLLDKIFGNGLNLIYVINYKAIGSYIWAHNDFIQCLISHGIIGMLMYILIMTIFIKKSLKYKKNPMIKFMVVLVWLFNAFFNMFYTYFCSILCYPFLLMIISESKNDVFEMNNLYKKTKI